jgi:hypothetical protein
MPLNKSFYLRPIPLAMHFLEPVLIAESDTVESLKKKLFEIMKNYYLSGQNA